MKHSSVIHNKNKTSQKGLTLVELMIAIVLGLILIGAAGYAYLSGKQGFRTQNSVARLQENARTAFEILTYDLRQTGGSGCLTNNASTALASGIWYQEQPFGSNGQALSGYDGAKDSAPTTDDLRNSITAGDAFSIMRADTDREYKLTAASIGTGFTLNKVSGLSQGQLVVVTDCNNTWIGQIGAEPSGLNVTMTSAPAAPFANNSRLYPLNANLYHLRAGTTDNTTNALHIQSLGVSGNAPSTSNSELIEGVEDMQVVFGMDTDATADGSINGYYTATEVDAQSIAGVTTSQAKWSRVLSMRISLLMVSQTGETITGGSQTLTFPGWSAGTTTYDDDSRLRRVFTTTIAIRNRL